jgi:hypothetical protein
MLETLERIHHMGINGQRGENMISTLLDQRVLVSIGQRRTRSSGEVRNLPRDSVVWLDEGLSKLLFLILPCLVSKATFGEIDRRLTWR